MATLTKDNRTVFRGGAGVFNNLLPLNVGNFEDTQQRVITAPRRRRDDAGRCADGDAQRDRGRLRRPRSVNWTAELDREIGKGLLVEVGFQQRDTHDDTVVDVKSAQSALVLRSDGHSRYRETRVVTRYKLNTTDQVVAAYTHTSAIGNLNDFNTYFGDQQNPVIRPDERGPLPWDSPNRFLVYSTLSLPWKLTFLPGRGRPHRLPAVRGRRGPEFRRAPQPCGAVSRVRFVRHAAHEEFRVFGHNATIGVKVFNITNHFNPRDFQENLASSDPGGFSNGVPRTIRGKWVIEF